MAPAHCSEESREAGCQQAVRGEQRYKSSLHTHQELRHQVVEEALPACHPEDAHNDATDDSDKYPAAVRGEEGSAEGWQRWSSSGDTTLTSSSVQRSCHVEV